MARAAGKSGRVESIFGLVNASLARKRYAEFVTYTAKLVNTSPTFIRDPVTRLRDWIEGLVQNRRSNPTD